MKRKPKKSRLAVLRIKERLARQRQIDDAVRRAITEAILCSHWERGNNHASHNRNHHDPN